MTKKNQKLDNPDVVIADNGDITLTLAVNTLNNERWGEGVKIKASEATYEARREAFRATDDRDFFQDFPRECSAVELTLPLAQAKGYAIGSTIVVTIRRG